MFILTSTLNYCISYVTVPLSLCMRVLILCGIATLSLFSLILYISRAVQRDLTFSLGG